MFVCVKLLPIEWGPWPRRLLSISWHMDNHCRRSRSYKCARLIISQYTDSLKVNTSCPAMAGVEHCSKPSLGVGHAGSDVHGFSKVFDAGKVPIPCRSCRCLIRRLDGASPAGIPSPLALGAIMKATFKVSSFGVLSQQWFCTRTAHFLLRL
jgi:hypothetical protein